MATQPSPPLTMEATPGAPRDHRNRLRQAADMIHDGYSILLGVSLDVLGIGATGDLHTSWVTAMPTNCAEIVTRTRELSDVLVAGPDDLVEKLVAALDFVEAESP